MKNEMPGLDEVREFQLQSGKRVCVANVKGTYFAIDNVCPHQGAALGQGTVESGFVVCPWHGWQIDPETGVPEEEPFQAVERYRLEINGDQVFIEA